MPKRSDISSNRTNSLPRGEGLGMGGTAVRGQCDFAGLVNPSPTRWHFVPASLPLEGRGLRAVAGEVEFFSDRHEHAVGVLQDVVVPEADYPVTVRFDGCGARIVSSVFSVLAAIEFDREPGGAASEVDHEIADWQLARELCSVQLAGAQVRPQPQFRVGHVAAQLACDAGQSLSHQGRTPIPNPFPAGKGL